MNFSGELEHRSLGAVVAAVEVKWGIQWNIGVRWSGGGYKTPSS